MNSEFSTEKQHEVTEVKSIEQPQKLENVLSIDDFREEERDELDIGARFLLEHPQYADYPIEEEKKVLWKVDLLLMPIMTVLITLAAADKIVVSNALLYSMTADLALVGTQYSWLTSIFYFGYLVFEFPANYLLQKLPVARTLIISFIIWNIILMCMGATQSFALIAALRFLLGMGETFLFPFCTIITGMFYKKSEQAIRTSIWFSGFSSIITGILSYGIGHAHSSISNWRLLFIAFGGITIFFTIIAFFLLPNDPMSWKYLSERERYIVIHRTIENRTGQKNRKFKKDQAIEALLDWKTWVMALFVFSINIPNAGLVTFASQIVSGTIVKVSTPPTSSQLLQTVLYGMPTGLFMTLSSFMISIPALFTPKKYRTVYTGLICLVPLICCCIMMKLQHTAGKKGLLMAYYFFYFYWGPYVSMTAININNTAGSSKKTVVNAVNFISYCVGSIVAPQLFITSEAPGYKTGYNSILGFIAAAIVLISIYGTGCYLENYRRDKKYGPAEDNVDPILDAQDLTDKQKEKWFRYVW